MGGKSGDAGLTFYCSTQAGEDHRYVIGNVRSWASAEEKDSVSAYNGPDFEDVDDKVQVAQDHEEVFGVLSRKRAKGPVDINRHPNGGAWSSCVSLSFRALVRGSSLQVSQRRVG